MTTKSARIKKIALTLAKAASVFFVLAILSFFGFRNMILGKVIDRIAARFRTQYQTTFTVREARFTGLSSISLRGITIVPDGRDTLVSIETINGNIRILPAFLLDYRLKELEIRDGYIHLVKNAQGRNIDAFLRREEAHGKVPEESVEPVKRNYATLIYKLISRMLGHVPNEMLVENLSLTLSEDRRFAGFRMERLNLANERLEAQVDVTTNTFHQHWTINGIASPSDKKADVIFYNNDTGMVRIPYVDQRFHLITGFDTVRLKLSAIEMNGNDLHITGFASIANFLVNHPRISKKDVVIERAEMDYAYLIGPDFISLDSSSTVRFNHTFFHPFIKYQQSPDTIYSLGVVINKMPAQDFINSLPEGLFTHFKGMEAEGSFEYRLDFAYNANQPTDLLFESVLHKEGLKILRYGEANLSKLNGDFVYVPIENGRAQRHILVSPANPRYTALDQLSPYLCKCVLTTEDPSFFYHRGFIDEAFRQSIIKNIRTKKFARGASTISMQLVKNVFLTREKTLSRKLEEILLVYILENNHLSSKERMLEVYLNIIEWGPNVYGIGEASEFYFKKRPSDLTIKECLFLATIIPRPKGFMWRFAKDGTVRDFANRQFRFLSEIMVRRGLLDPVDTMGLSSVPLSITGPAQKFIIKTDTLISDSILQEDLPEEE